MGNKSLKLLFRQFQYVLDIFHSITIPVFILFMQAALGFYTLCLIDLSNLFKIAFLFSVIATFHTLAYFASGYFVNRIYTIDEYEDFSKQKNK